MTHYRKYVLHSTYRKILKIICFPIHLCSKPLPIRRRPCVEPTSTTLSSYHQNLQIHPILPKPRKSFTLKTNLQQSSPLFSRLPFEIRQLIWEIYAGFMKIHLIIKEDEEEGASLRAIRCYHEYACLKMVWYNYDFHTLSYPGQSTMGVNVPALVGTCQRIYNEVIWIFMSQNEFLVNDEEILQHLPNFIPTPYINTLKYLKFNYTISFPPPTTEAPESWEYPSPLSIARQQWNAVWLQLAAMKLLRDLRVKLRFVKEDPWLCVEREGLGSLLEPVREITRPEYFELDLELLGSQCKNEGKEEWESLPARVLWIPELSRR